MRIGVFSLIAWELLDQRPQVMARALRQWGHEVIYLEPFTFDNWGPAYPHPWEDYEARAWRTRPGPDGMLIVHTLFVPARKAFRDLFERNRRYYRRNLQEVAQLNLDFALVSAPYWGEVLTEIGVPYAYDHLDDTHLMSFCDTDTYHRQTVACQQHASTTIYIQPNIARRYGGLYIPNGFSPDDLIFDPSIEKTYDAVCLTSITDWIDLDSLFSSRHRILLIGPVDPVIQPRFEELAAAPGVRLDHISYLPRKLASLWLNKGFCGLVPFREEHPVVDYAMPLKIPEYLFLGLPCVSHLNQGIIESFGDHIVTYSSSGWLGQPPLDEAIDLAMSDPRYKERRQLAESYSWPVLLTPLRNFFETV